MDENAVKAPQGAGFDDPIFAADEGVSALVREKRVQGR